MASRSTAVAATSDAPRERETMKRDLVARLLTKEEDEAERARLGLGALQSRIRAIRRLLLFAAITSVGVPIMLLLLSVRWRRGYEGYPLVHHRVCARLMGFRARIAGEMAAGRPVLFVSNHTSYLDIPLLGGVIPGCFVAKAEVGGWPVFGFLARLQRTVFVRRRRGAAREQAGRLARRIGDGDNLILFAEGTSNDGNRVLPFKSSLFSVAETQLSDNAGGERPSMLVQPVSVAYTSIDGLPMGRYLRPYFAWYGDMDLAPHLLEALSFGKVDVDIVFHEPVRLDQFESRKTLAAYCQSAVQAGVAGSISGREHAPPPIPALPAARTRGPAAAAKHDRDR